MVTDSVVYTTKTQVSIDAVGNVIIFVIHDCHRLQQLAAAVAE